MRLATLLAILAAAPCAATGGTLNGHPAAPAPRSEPTPVAPRATTLHEAATPAIEGLTEIEWRDRALAHQHALESTQAALAACEAREAPAPYRDYAGYYRPPARPRRGYQWVEIKNCDDARLDVEAAQRALDAFEETARRSSVPPGWMR